MDRHAPDAGSADSATIARRLVDARRQAQALPQYPGEVPQTLAAGYACQDEAIALWGRPVVGWKVGKIPADWEAKLGEERLVGPIFEGAVQAPGANDSATLQGATFAVIPGGFAAVEAEYVFRIGHDAPADKTDYTAQEAAALVDMLMVGVELAGSPLPLINVLGPPVVVSDFGNNTGLILGAEIEGWQRLPAEDLTCETFIDGHLVGEGGAASISGGLLAALAFALSRCASRGYPLKQGMLVTTGAATGIHDIVAGQRSRISFGRWGDILCNAVAATPSQEHA
ncbi:MULTISPECIES: 2-keto-4-pentenoate hydratase [unclassified Lysobacter]|uniref:2-keto-4-pentenoate hydratase n=1 Tax=unclassified Lysobacter TaxID=2635362 RepID=UPI001C22BE82|nr:2-keto-4-pentenoate hydratase [Lysobacter sp. MMG2]MBU8975995.1 2-keto-4-pentenoate hydratase [Lysobacter sp. MMG2]